MKTTKAKDRAALVDRGYTRSELQTYERDAAAMDFTETVSALLRRAAERCSVANLRAQIAAQKMLQTRALAAKKTKAAAFYGNVIELLDSVVREKTCREFRPAEGKAGRDGVCVCGRHQEEHAARARRYRIETRALGEQWKYLDESDDLVTARELRDHARKPGSGLGARVIDTEVGNAIVL